MDVDRTPDNGAERSFVSDLFHSTVQAVSQPLRGVEQLCGGSIIDPPSADGNVLAQSLGTTTGTVLVYSAATFGARLAFGRFGGLIAGGTLGFLAPTDGGLFSRLEHGALGAVATAAGYSRASGLRDSYLPHAEPEFAPGKLVKDWVKVDGRYRQYKLRLPEAYDAKSPTPLVVAADSSLIAPGLLSAKGYIHGMDDVNGIGRAANEYNTLVAYPIPQKRWGFFYTWNSPEGVLSLFGARKHDDAAYMQAVLERIKQRANVDPNRVFGFGYDHGGAKLEYDSGVLPAGTFKGLSVWASTVSPRFPTPRQGTMLQVGHSLNDPVLDFYNRHRGALAVVPEKFGYDNLKIASPHFQAPRVAAANGVTEEPAWEHPSSEYQIRTWHTATGQPIAQEVLLTDRIHGVPGRLRGGSNESLTSRLNAQGAPTSVSAVDFAFNRWFGLAKLAETQHAAHI